MSPLSPSSSSSSPRRPSIVAAATTTTTATTTLLLDPLYSSSILIALAIGYAIGNPTWSNEFWNNFILDNNTNDRIIEDGSTAEHLSSSSSSSVTSSSSPPSWWSLSKALIVTYVTIRWYHIIIEPMIRYILTSILSSTGLLYAFPGIMIDSSNPNSGNVGNNNTVDATTAATIASRRRSSLTAKDIAVFANVKEVHLSTLTEEGSQDIMDDDEEDEDEDSRKQLQKQPIDMSGLYQLVENYNFEEFLEAQGVPWMLRRAANQARPTHRITHIGQHITIKIEGLIESTSTYTINGDPVEGLIRGRLFADKVTYLTPQDIGEDDNDEEEVVVDVANDDDDNSEHDETESGGFYPNTASKNPQESTIVTADNNENKKQVHSPKGIEVPTNSKLSSISATIAAGSALGDQMKRTLDNIGTSTTNLMNVDDMKKGFNNNVHDMKKGFNKTMETLKESINSMDNNKTESTKKVVDDDEPTKVVDDKPQVVEDTQSDSPDTMKDEQETKSKELSVDTKEKKTKKRKRKKKHVRIIGLKTTKRAINDGYTIVVCRQLTDDGSKIIMTSSVEFDDKTKNKGSGSNGKFESRQIFDRIDDA